jgi:hypothetical protein
MRELSKKHARTRKSQKTKKFRRLYLRRRGAGRLQVIGSME